MTQVIQLYGNGPETRAKSLGKIEDRSYDGLFLIYQSWQAMQADFPVKFGDFVAIYQIGRESRF